MAICYKYQLSDQYPDQSSDKNISFYLQRCSEHYLLHTRLETLVNYSLNDSQADQMTKSKTEAHTSSFGPRACTLAQSGDQALLPSQRTSGIYPLHYKTLSTRCYSATATKTLPTVKNRPMDRKGRPPDIKPFSSPITHSHLIPVATTTSLFTHPQGSYIYK